MEHVAGTPVGRLHSARLGELAGELEALAAVDTPDDHGDPEGLRRVGRVGDYLLVEQDGHRLVAVVERIEERRVWLNPVGEILAGPRLGRGVSRMPLPGARLVRPSAEVLRHLFGDTSGDRFALGQMTIGRERVPVGLEPAQFFGRHVAILGQSGAGKSWAVANLIQRTVEVMPRAHVVLLDLHGEYCWQDDDGMRRAAFDPSIVRSIEARELEIPFWILSFSEMIDLLVDRNDEHAATQIAHIRRCVEFLRRQSNPELDLPHMTVDTPVYFPLEGLFSAIKEANDQMLDFGKTKGPLFGIFDQLLLRFESRMNDRRYAFLFRPRRRTSSASLEALLRDFVGLGEPRRQVTVIDMSSVPFDVRPVVSAQIGRLAFEFNYWNPARREFPLFLVCEEAHAYIPREQGTRYAGARESMERIAKEGRKYGVGLCVVSQRPKEVSETVLAQCGNFLCLRMTNPDDQAYVQQLVPEGERTLMRTVASLGRGEVLALGEALTVPTRFRFFKPHPTPNSRDVDFFTGWSAGPEDLDVARIVERWREQRQGR